MSRIRSPAGGCKRDRTASSFNQLRAPRVAHLQAALAARLGGKVARLTRALQNLKRQPRMGDQPLDEGIAQGGGGGPEAAAKV